MPTINYSTYSQRRRLKVVQAHILYKRWGYQFSFIDYKGKQKTFLGVIEGDSIHDDPIVRVVDAAEQYNKVDHKVMTADCRSMLDAIHRMVVQSTFDEIQNYRTEITELYERLSAKR